jgi:spore coat polysaccharide biosynthesis protein SpsF (cytidylyltransferase family)
MTVGALIPMRLDSSRLPEKALLDVAGLPAVQRLITQVAACGYVSHRQILVCTTARAEDDRLAATAAALGVGVFRGSTDDLIDRLRHAALSHQFDTILQVDGDDLCADPGYMAACLEAVLRGDGDVACCPEGLPLGAASKAFRYDCLETVFQAYIPGKNDTGFSYYLTRSRMFKVVQAALDPLHRMPGLRLTLDYPEDLELFRFIFQQLRAGTDKAVSLTEVCALARAHPHLREINAALDPGYWHRTRELMARNPLRLRIGAETVQLDVE